LSLSISPLGAGVNLKAFAKDFFSVFAKDWFVQVVQEMATVATIKILTGQNTETCLGKGDEDRFTLFDKSTEFGGSKVKINSFLPVESQTISSGIPLKGGISSTAKKDIIILLFKPICGALAYYLINVYKNYGKYKKRWSWKKIFVNSLLDIDHFWHLIDELLPNGENNGGKIIKALDGEANTNGFMLYFLNQVAKLGMTELIWKMRKGKFIDSYKLKQEDIVRMGNRAIMRLSNKSLCAIKEEVVNSNSSIFNTDFDREDIGRLLYLYFWYLDAAGELYG